MVYQRKRCFARNAVFFISPGDMVKLADTGDLKSPVFGLAGSSPAIPTIYFISEPDSFRKRFGYVFFDRNFCERTIRNGKQERTKTGYPFRVSGAFWVNRCVSEACISLAITHQTLCQGAQPPLKFLRSVYAHKQPNDQDLLYNVFFHWKVWYTRLNKMGFVEVVTWIGQKS